MQWTSFKFSCFLRVHADDGSTAVAVFRVVLLTLAFLVNVISGQYFKEMSSRRAARTQGLVAQILVGKGRGHCDLTSLRPRPVRSQRPRPVRSQV